MISSGFGRRIVEPGGRALTLVPNRGASGPAADLAGRVELKDFTYPSPNFQCCGFQFGELVMID